MISVAKTATKNVGIGVVIGSTEFPQQKVQLDLSNSDILRFIKNLGPLFLVGKFGHGSSG
jgi:hypothetical protein